MKNNHHHQQASKRRLRFQPLASIATTIVLLGTMATGQAALRDGLVTYWPLDQVVGNKTPDLASGYDMELANLTAADLVAGKFGKAFKFENARQTMLKRVNGAGEKLPINQHLAFTISFWANVTGTGLSDLRLFSEANIANNNPLFNLGTHNGGAGGQLDFYFRQSGWTDVNHLKTEVEPLDGTWRHIVFVQQTDGARALYVDGVKDNVEIAAKADGAWNVNSTSIGGILRANPTHWLTGLMDEVATWSRALTEAEIKQVGTEGMVSVFPPLANGMVAYWPLDEVIGVKTPDLVNGYDMELSNMTAADQVAGKFGKAFQFENSRQTFLKRVGGVGEKLPINQHPAFTISIWANVKGTGLTDLRLFSEGTTSDNNPLFNIGTDNGGGTDKLDLFFRQTGLTTVNHIKSETDALDGTWRHIAFVQQTDGARALYIDGAKDPLEIPAKEAGAWRVSNTSIGGILRANPTHWLTGLLDDVALWDRALSEAELKELVTKGTPIPFSQPQPLAIRSFTSDLTAVAVGDSIWLRWDGTKNVQVTIDQGVGDVTSKTVAGLGSVQVPMTSSKEFTLSLIRGTETVTKKVSVAAISGIATGWTLIDNFDRHNLGLLNRQGGWGDLDAVDFSVLDVKGNRMVGAHDGNATASLSLGPLTVIEGKDNTLFFRVMRTGDLAEEAKGTVALSDRNVRFGGDVGTAGNDIGPGAVLDSQLGAGLMAGGANGNGSPVEFFEPIFDLDIVYNVWVDIKNGPFPADATSTGDTYSIYVAKDGAAQRTKIITDFVSARGQGQADVGFATRDLNKLIIGGLGGTSTTTNLFFDDIYLSKSGYLATVPRIFGMTTPVQAQPGKLSASLASGQITITWTEGGTLEYTSSLTAPITWTSTGDSDGTYSAAAGTGIRYYRVRQ